MFEKILTKACRLLPVLAAALLANTTALADSPSRLPMQDKNWDASDPFGHTVYFYDKEMRNITVSAHVWNRTEGSADTPFHSWEMREQLKFTGKQIIVDGKPCPVYEYDFWWGGNTPTHLVFQLEKNGSQAATATGDLIFTEGALYSLDDPAGSEGRAGFDITTAEDADPGLRHTVYFAYDSRYFWNSASTFVHVWGTGGDLHPWEFNEYMSLIVTPDPNPAYGGTPKYVWNGTDYVQVFEYSFWYLDGEPTNLLFHTDTSNTYYYYGTGDLDFVDGALYTYAGNGIVTEPVADPEILDNMPQVTGTFYVADTDGWMAPGNTLTTWSTNMRVKINGMDWSPIQYAQDTSFKDKYVEINGRWYPLYKFDFTSGSGKLQTIGLANDYWTKRTSAAMPWKDGGVYYFSGEKVASKVLDIAECKVSDGIPPEGAAPHRKATFYLNLGANQIMETELWQQPYCRPVSRPADIWNTSRYASPYGQVVQNYVRDENGLYVIDPETGMYMMEYKFEEPLEGQLPTYGNRTDADAMEQVAPGLWKFTVDDVADFDDVLFYYYTPECTGSENMVLVIHPASRSRYFDPTTWDNYVFDIGTDCVHQSYLTIDEYEPMRQKELSEATTLYLAGSSAMSGLTGQDDPINSVAVEADHGCFFYEFEVSEDAAASFKISTMDVAGIVGSKQLTDHYSFQRGWATYNLGIVGCHMDPTAEDYTEWYDSHVIRPQAGASREIFFKTNESLGYNRYTQYAWRVAVGDDGVAQAGKYWLVVDFLDDDQSVTLLDFDPHPHAVARPTGSRQVDVPADKAEEMHGGEYLAASTHNGKVLFDKVNVISGEIDIEGTGQHLIEEQGFEVAYTLWLDGEKALVRDGKPEKIEMDFMNIGDDASLAVRARFHDTKTGRYFSTRFSDGTVEADTEMFPAPAAEVVDKAISGYRASETAPWTIAAVALVSYEAGDSPLASYPDYEGYAAEISGNPADGASYPLLHHSHPYVGYGWGSYVGALSDTPWNPAGEDEEFSEDNNWSAYIAREGQMSVLAENLDQTTSLPYRGDCRYNIDVASVYPLLSRHTGFDLKVDGDDTRKASAASAAGFPEDLSGYTLTSVRSVTPVEVEIPNAIVSAVADVMAGEPEDGPVETYDLQGKPVTGDPAPGVYIIRKGSKVTKRVIR